MQKSIFCSPSRYTQGAGVTEILGMEMQLLGLEGPVLIVAGRSAASHLMDIWKASLAQADYPYLIHHFGGECTDSEISSVIAKGQEFGARTVVGSGGGKVIDTARAAAADLAAHVVSCPSIASSDAPCSALSVLYKADGSYDRYRIYGRNPDLVLVDTKLIAQSPRRHLVAGMGDALATWFEAEACEKAGALNARGGTALKTAISMARLCFDTLMKHGRSACVSIEKNEVSKALEHVVEANTLLSGLGFESGGLAAAHAIHNGLTKVPQTHSFMHGEKVAFGTISQLVMQQADDSLLQEVTRFCKDVGLPTTFAELGLREISNEDLKAIARGAVAPDETIHNMPFSVSEKMVIDSMKAASALSYTS
ncbi:MAG: glycerol dehydrogenase [Phycisphaerales bacterium]|nr:glycerol dehydrogenase [Phycisphaerales bacterium]